MNFQDMIVDFGFESKIEDEWDWKRKQKINQIGDYRYIEIKDERTRRKEKDTEQNEKAKEGQKKLTIYHKKQKVEHFLY